MPDTANAVSVQQLFTYLRTRRRQWPIAKIAAAAKLPRSVVRQAIDRGNPKLSTVLAIAKVLGGDVVVVITPGQNQLLDP